MIWACQHFNHKLSNCHAAPPPSPYTLHTHTHILRYIQDRCVYWILDFVINTFSTLFPSGAPPTSKEVEDGVVSLSVSLCLSVYEAAQLSAPRHRRGAAEEIWFHDYHTATRQVGLWFVKIAGFSYTWLWADHTNSVFIPQDQIWKSLCASFLWFCTQQRW